MSKLRPTIRLVPMGDRDRFQDLRIANAANWTLSDLLAKAPALSTQPIDVAIMGRRLADLNLVVLDDPLYFPPGFAPQEAVNGTNVAGPSGRGSFPVSADVESGPGTRAPTGHPDRVEEKDAVVQAYAREIDRAASFLRVGLSVLVYCDKLVVEHLWREVVRRSALESVLLELADDDGDGLMPRSMRQRQLARLKELIRNLKVDQVLVIRHLDLLAGGSDANLSTESRELTELAYETGDRLILAFADRSLDVPEVLAARFAVRLTITGVWRTVITQDGERPLGEALVTAEEASRFRGFDAEGLYKNVSGMNPIRLRQALRYAFREYADKQPVPVARLYEALRAFKAQTSARFEVPDVTFEQIGGYAQVKAELAESIKLMLGGFDLESKLRSELIPRGFIFYGPPGTGKTLFAKAVANQMNATIQVVSGPEVTDMYVGESERKVRELFAEARRNAPSVLVFDEFDSIASRRSGRDDGGSRAGNALVAQILTEMDGFRPDVPMLVIGTTNRLDIIDDALLRPSRFKAMSIGLPDVAARRAIAAVHARHFLLEVPAALLDVVADSSDGLNGDEIRSVFRDACLAWRLHGVSPDARQLGRLVGRLRRAMQQKDAQTAGRPTSGMSATRRGGPPAPSGSMTLLTPPEDVPASPPQPASPDVKLVDVAEPE